MEARLRTLGDFVARELESELRAQMFRITAVRRAGRAGGKAAAFLARRTETPSQVHVFCFLDSLLPSETLDASVLQVNIEMGQQPYPTMSSLVKERYSCAARHQRLQKLAGKASLRAAMTWVVTVVFGWFCLLLKRLNHPSLRFQKVAVALPSHLRALEVKLRVTRPSRTQ